MDISLVILAAGIGSRFGGVKQLEAAGPDGETIIEYSIHDAIAAGFNKVVFILRRDIFTDFMDVLGSRLEARFRAHGVKWEYVFQELTDPPEGRTKPWGTGQALLACRDVLHEPFAVINSDDYYGCGAYRTAYDFLSSLRPGDKGRFGMVGFILKNTLSDIGGVTRGVCRVDASGFLAGVEETRGIVKTPGGAAVPEGDGLRPVDPDSIVSMNMWMFTPDLLAVLGPGFEEFRKNLTDPLKQEYLLPEIVDSLLHSGRATVQVLQSHDRWFGVTYREDLPLVRKAFAALYEAGVYRPDLYSDIPRS